MHTPPFAIITTIVLTAVVVLLVYYVFLVRTILEMLRRQPHIVLVVFAFVTLCPLPPCVVMGVVVMIIWHLHKQTLPLAPGT